MLRSLMYIIRDNTGQVRRVKSLEEVAKIMQLDPHEIAWALEEYGRCETDAHCVVVGESGMRGNPLVRNRPASHFRLWLDHQPFVF